MNSLTCRLLGAILVFCPLAFGTVEMWSITIMETACLAAVFVFFISTRVKKKTAYKVPGIVPLFLFLGYLLFQMTPLPAGMIRLISPATYDIYLGTVGILDMPDFLSLSMNKNNTLGEFFRFAAYAAVYIVTIQLFTDKNVMRKTVRLVLILGFGIALLAILHHFTSNGKIFWFREAPPRSGVFGPYIYHNHFAGYMEMLVPVTLSLFFYYSPRYSYDKSLRQRLIGIINHPTTNVHALLGFAAVVMAVSIFLSLSRGGVISLCLSCLFLLVFLPADDRKRRSVFLAFCLISCMIMAVSWFGLESLADKFMRIEDNIKGGRVMFWRDCLGIIKDFPFFGTGTGAFANIFPSYRSFQGNFFVYNAHNDYIQSMINAGAVGCVLMICFLGSILLKTIRTIKSRRESYSRHLWIGSLAGMVALLIHSVTDFNFQNGANALYFFFLAGLTVSAANTRLRGRTPTKLAPAGKIFSPMVSLAVTAVVLTGCLLFNSGKLFAEFQAKNIGPMNWTAETPSEKLNDVTDKATKAISYDPFNSYYHFALAYVADIQQDQQTASRHYEKAIRLNPLQSTYLQEFALFLGRQQRIGEAEQFMKAGIRHDRSDGDRYREYARWLISMEERRRGLEAFKDVFVLSPDASDIIFLANAGFKISEIQQVMPDRVRPWMLFGDYLRSKGRHDAAEKSYLTALGYIGNEKKIKAHYFYKLINLYKSKKRYADALGIARRAIDALPENEKLRITAARLYEREGLSHRAMEEYRRALVINPDNHKARQRLAELL